jgi:hypothetical protein
LRRAQGASPIGAQDAILSHSRTSGLAARLLLAPRIRDHMKLGDYLEKWGRTLFETPLATSPKPDEPTELAEVRLAILDQIRDKSYRSGGKKVFPFDMLSVRMKGIAESQTAVYSGRFFRRYLEQEVRNSLKSAGCSFPEDLSVEVEASSILPGPDEKWLSIEARSRDRRDPASSPAARLVVAEGKANTPEIRLDKPRTNIGRVVDVYRSEGLFRRNDLAFAEETEVNRSVSREHAHITFDKTSGEHRLFNDRWYPREGAGVADCATWVVRDGVGLEVHRDARGVKLQPGDEIHLGSAVLIFQVD